ncbi:SusC/RagA family TonB-linked outer membrane protein [Flammeovirga sp. MY04]|uniref:SusC/RagA family TonB-linked outer membrane protein n=1 Tax=Flammeovirga sp. MY04 TaxID=1191459 RepID=UPI0008243728|nr:SusC/RagA family TonB-linked outer membrane protein [Flammeovirga sp. MY04]ANQ52020.2 SusC/RagA family TonB-linked outer membrane protein [Flammeovirga sp. MY04]
MKKIPKPDMKRYSFIRLAFHCLCFLSFISLFGLSNHLNAQTVAANKITLTIKNQSLKQVITDLKEKTNYDFIYVSHLFDDYNNINFSCSEASIEEVLTQLLSNKPIKFAIENNKVIFSRDDTKVISEEEPEQESKKVKVFGIVTDDTGMTIPGANVIIKGTTIGASTDFEGKFTMLVDKFNYLMISAIGYKTQEFRVGNRTSFNVQLVREVTALEEVLVVGYGTQKKADIIGSVSSVKGDALEVTQNPSFEASLQGMAAGVSVQTSGGAPGARTVIKIRGTGSINSSTDPLWVIDGMPVYSNPYGLGSSGQSPMSLINPNDIESIEVLKDAAATSIYGSRGSNGVILVTTKSGKKGTGYTSFSHSTGFSQLTRTPQDLGYSNTNDWFGIMDEAYQNTYSRDFKTSDHYRFSPFATTKIDREDAEKINTDWFNELFRPGVYHDYNLSSSRGFDDLALYISANYRNDKGVQNHNNFERFGLLSNLDFKPGGDRLKFGAKINIAYTNNERRESGTTSVITYALPWFPVQDPDNPTNYYNPYTGSNPVAMNDPRNTLNNVKQYRGLAGLYLDYKIPGVDGLSFRSELSTDILQSNVVEWQSKDIYLNGGQEPTSRAREEAVTYSSINLNGFLTYQKTFEKHDFNIVGGLETQQMSQYSRVLQGEGLTGIYQELGNPNVMTDMYAGLNGERYLMGFFGRFNYKFNNKYLFGISLRRDGTSAFTADHRWGTFIAASAGWFLSDEPFMDFLGDDVTLKLRGSYGETGNQNVQSGLDVINYNGNVSYGGQGIMGVNGTLPINLAVNNLTWETTRSADVGLDFGFLGNKINGSIAYYSRYVDGMLLPVPVPWSAGVSSDNLDFGQGTYDYDKNSIFSNVGDMINSGLELEFYTVNIKKGSFEWRTSFNIALNKNEIISLTPELDDTGKGLIHSNTPSVSRSSRKRKEWYISDWAGVDPTTGVPMIYVVDQNHYNQTGETRRAQNSAGQDSLTYATTTNMEQNRFYQEGKSADPTYYGGITNSFNFKGFDFSFMFTFSGGNYIMDYDRQISTVPNETRMLLSEVRTDSWKKEGDIAKYPQLRARGTYIVDGKPMTGFDNSDVYHNRELYKGDFIRLRNVSLGYNFSDQLCSKLRMKSFRIYVQGTNLWTFTEYPGFDPEGAEFVKFSSSIPQTKSVVIGLNANF